MSQPYIDPTALCVSGSTGIEPTASAKLIGPLTACLTGGGKTGGGNTGGETGGETGGGDTGEETGGGENEGGDTVEGATQAANLATKSCSRPYLNMSCMLSGAVPERFTNESPSRQADGRSHPPGLNRARRTVV